MEESKKGSYITGLIGLVIGGLIATIPWILVYVYGNMMFSILSVLIAVGEFYGYTIFKGKPTKKLPIIIIVMAVIIVALTSLVIIPSFLIMKEGVNVSIDAVKSLYSSEEFATAILKDTGIAVVFTLFGAGAMSSYIKNKMTNDNIVEAGNVEETEKKKQEAIKKIKPIFSKFNAFVADHGIQKDELDAEISTSNELKEPLELLKSLKIVKKSKSKFFYDESAESSEIKLQDKKTSNTVLVIIGILLVVVMVGVIVLNQMGILNKKQVSNDNMSFEVNGKWIEYESYYTDVWTYYRYINTKEPAMDEEIEEGDYDKLPAYLNVSTTQVNTEEVSNIQDIQQNMKDYTNTLESNEKPSLYEDSIDKTTTGYDVLKIKMEYDADHNRIEYLYYILNGEEAAIVDVISYNMDDAEELVKTAEEVAQSFKWNN